jgi:hypothetical protein
MQNRHPCVTLSQFVNSLTHRLFLEYDFSLSLLVTTQCYRWAWHLHSPMQLDLGNTKILLRPA